MDNRRDTDTSGANAESGSLQPQGIAESTLGSDDINSSTSSPPQGNGDRTPI